jgi:hypothetical protein
MALGDVKRREIGGKGEEDVVKDGFQGVCYLLGRYVSRIIET